MPDDRIHLMSRKYYGNIGLPLGSRHFANLAEVLPENMPEKEEQSVERLVLQGCGHITLHCKPGEERFDVLRTERRQISVLSEPMELPHPMTIGLEGLGRIMFGLGDRNHVIDCAIPRRISHR